MIRRELSIFLVVGLLSVALDFIVYRSLAYFFLCNISLAKASGFISGSFFAYFANRFWTFKQQSTRSGSLWRFILVYSMGLLLNVLINQGILLVWDNSAALYIAFLMATGISAAINFMGMKSFVFTQRSFVSSA